MKFGKEHVSGIGGAVIELVIGLLLLINPVGFTSGIIVGLGVLMIVAGATKTARYFMTNAVEAAREQGLAKGLLLLMVGAACALCSDWFVAVFPLLTMLYGLLLLVLSALKVQFAVDMLRLKKQNWLFSAISAAVSVVIAVFVLVNPFGATTLIWVTMGLTLIADAVLDALCLFYRKKTA